MNKKKLYILLSLVLFSLAVTYVDAIVHPTYFYKIMIKIIFFLALPMLYFLLFQEERSGLKLLFSFKKKGIITSLIFGIVIFFIIFLGFVFTRGFIDYSNVTSSLTSGMGITRDNFIFVAIYISILNSFLEEFFFRGFGFITLKKLIGTKLAYLFSPIFFAIYHSGMMYGMFHTVVFVLLMLGLFVGGLIFNYLNDKYECLYPSWFTHMFANFAINTVGFILFNA